MADESHIQTVRERIHSLSKALAELRRRRAVEDNHEERDKYDGEIQEYEEELAKAQEDLTVLRNDAEAEAEETAIENADHSKSDKEEAAAGVAGVIPETAIAAPFLAAKAAHDKKKEEAKARKKGEKAANKARKKSSKGSGGIVQGYKNADAKFRQAQENASAAVVNSAVAFDKHAHPWLFFLVALFIHGWDVANGFSRGGQQGMLMLTAYALFALYAALFYYRTGFTKESTRYFLLSLVAWGVPYLFQLPIIGPFLQNIDYLLVLLMVAPLWALYIALHEDESTLLYRLCRFWTILIAIALFIIAIGMVTFPDVFSGHGLNLGKPLQSTWTTLQDSWATVKDRLGVMFNIAAWRQRINQTFNPYAQYYAGQVEDNKEEPHGVYITQLESLYPKTYVGSDIVTRGRIEAKTFLPGGIVVEPSCRLERPGKGFWFGTPDVKPFEVNYKLIRDVLCTYPAEVNMTPGSYNAVLGATFKFETWGYITNTFVSRQLFDLYNSQDQDINDVLDIDRYSEAIYTNGPVMIGINAVEQPIDIDVDSDSPVKQRFGFTIQSRWSQGEITEVENVEVLVPEPFILENCYPAAPTAEPDPENRVTHYIFDKKAGLLPDQRYDYSSVTCQLQLPSKEAAEQVVGFAEKTPVTFVVLARYTYQIEKEERVRVEI